MKMSRITFVCKTSLVQVIAGLLIDRVTSFSIEDASDKKHHSGKGAKPQASGAEGPAAKEIVAHMKSNPKKEFTSKDKDLGAILEKNGLKKTSLSPVLSNIHKSGLITRPRRGFYVIGV